MQELKLTRKFDYNGITLGDPNPMLAPEAVRELYAAHYPELINAVVEGPTTSNNISTYKFVRVAGSKGRGEHSAMHVQAYLRQIVATAVQDVGGNADLQAGLKCHHQTRAMQQVVMGKPSPQTLAIPSGAIGLWG